MKIKQIILIIICTVFICGCNNEETNTKDNSNETSYSELINYEEALELFEEGMEAEVLDVETGITFNVRRVVGGYETLADVETLTQEDTDKLLEAAGEWGIIRRSVIVTIGDHKIAASISPFYHSGDENYAYGEIIDNRSGATGTGINLDSIRDNGMIGVVDIYFYNSLTPGINRIDERHQEMVLEAYDYKG